MNPVVLSLVKKKTIDSVIVTTGKKTVVTGHRSPVTDLKLFPDLQWVFPHKSTFHDRWRLN